MAFYPSKRITGFQGAVPQNLDLSYSPRTGGITKQTFRGPLATLLPLIADLQNNGWDWHLHDVNNGASWALEATISAIFSTNSGLTDNPVDIWEITSNKVEKDFLNSQNALVASLTASDVRALQAFIQNPPAAILPAAQVTDTSVTPPVPLSSAGQTAYNLILAGVKSTVIFQPILKHTQTTSNVYAVQNSYTNVGKILATSTLNALIPRNVNFSLPADPAFGISGSQYGWLVDFPNSIASAFNKTQIIQEFEFGLWSTALYGNPI